MAEILEGASQSRFFKLDHSSKIKAIPSSTYKDDNLQLLTFAPGCAKRFRPSYSAMFFTKNGFSNFELLHLLVPLPEVGKTSKRSL